MVNKNQSGFTVLESLIVLLLILVISGAGWLVYQKNHKTSQLAKLPEATYASNENTYPGWTYGQADPSRAPASREEVIASANKYIISKVGQSNFDKMFALVPSRHAFASPSDSTFDFIAYYFKPDNIYNPEIANNPQYVTFVQVNRNRLAEIYEKFVPDCVNNPAQCSFTLSLEKAKDIGKKNGLNDINSVSIGRVPNEVPNPNKLEFALHVASCPQKEDLIIDYSSGKVLGAVACPPEVNID